MATFFVTIFLYVLHLGSSAKVGGYIIDLRKPHRYSVVTNMYTLNL